MLKIQPVRIVDFTGREQLTEGCDEHEADFFAVYEQKVILGQRVWVPIAECQDQDTAKRIVAALEGNR